LNGDLHFDYTTVGHVTIDVLADGTRRAGGSAFYSALQAARLGKRTRIVTQGVRGEIEALLEPYRDELQLCVLSAASTTTLLTRGSGAARSQRVLAWAGPIAHPPALELDTEILHLAPVARELSGAWATDAWAGSRRPARFVGLTPQGLARAWSDGDGVGQIEQAPPDADAERLARRCHAIVLSDYERGRCARVIASASAAGALVAVTAGGEPTTILLPGGQSLTLDVAPLQQPRDDLGAGDVFAAAFFIALSDGRTPREAGEFANAAAAVRMRGEGARAIGGRAEIEARLHAGAARGDA